jgi:hypothetical protein
VLVDQRAIDRSGAPAAHGSAAVDQIEPQVLRFQRLLQVASVEADSGAWRQTGQDRVRSIVVTPSPA